MESTMHGLATSQPFVLLDDARTTGAADARLFTRPSGVITADSFDQVHGAFDELKAALARGQIAAGYISYEVGLALEDRLRPLRQTPDGGLPLIWMGLFDSVERIASKIGSASCRERVCQYV